MQSLKRLQIDVRKALWVALGFSAFFTVLIAMAGSNLAQFNTLTERTTLTNYLWKLNEPTAFTRFVAWGSYVVHQLFSWGIIWFAKRQALKYSSLLHPANIAALLGNGAFVWWHFIQTHWTYDATAQDVGSWTSQASVILMLVLILAMETPRRGLFFGQRLPFHKEFIRLLRKYHGYIFSWAIVYTFWFHPMVSTQGHLIGFFYMFMLLIQSSLFFTTLHVNRIWTFILEVSVLPHGVLVAMQQGANFWPTFFMGFMGLVIVTQMHGLGLSRRAKWLIFAAFLLTIPITYGLLIGRWSSLLRDLTAISLIEYGSVFVAYALFMLGLGGVRLWQRLTTRATVSV